MNNCSKRSLIISSASSTGKAYCKSILASFLSSSAILHFSSSFSLFERRGTEPVGRVIPIIPFT